MNEKGGKVYIVRVGPLVAGFYKIPGKRKEG